MPLGSGLFFGKVGFCFARLGGERSERPDRFDLLVSLRPSVLGRHFSILLMGLVTDLFPNVGRQVLGTTSILSSVDAVGLLVDLKHDHLRFTALMANCIFWRRRVRFVCVRNNWSHRGSFEFVFSGGPAGSQRSGGQRRPPPGCAQTYPPSWLPVVLPVVCFHCGSCASATNRNLHFVFFAGLQPCSEGLQLCCDGLHPASGVRVLLL